MVGRASQARWSHPTNRSATLLAKLTSKPGQFALVVFGTVHVGKYGGSRDRKVEYIVRACVEETPQAGLIVVGQYFLSVPPGEQERMSAVARMCRYDDPPACGREAVEHGVDQFGCDCRLIAEGHEHRPAIRRHSRQTATDRGQHVGPLVVGVDNHANAAAFERLAEALCLVTCDDADFFNAAPQQLVDDVSDDGCPRKGEQLLRDTHAARLAGGRHDGDDHSRAPPAARR